MTSTIAASKGDIIVHSARAFALFFTGEGSWRFG